jgi:hypothetical protein
VPSYLSGRLVADQMLPRYRRKPPLYRLARYLSWTSTIVLVLIIVFVASAVYSAVDTARSGVGNSSFSTGFAANDTLAVTGSFTFDNGGFYPIDGFTLHLIVRNGTGEFVGDSTAGPVNFAPSVSQVFPITFYLPVSRSGPGVSLLTQDQTLGVDLWANATFATLFPISISLNSSRSWGAPFADFSASVGTPFPMGSTVEVPVTISFENHASFADAGTITVTVYSSADQDCGSGVFSLNVPPGSPYSQSTDIGLASGCNPSGGTVTTVYTNSDGISISLPTESIP